MAETGILTYQNQNFAGPGAYSTVNSNGLAGGATLAQPVVFLMGDSVGGAPGQVLRIMSESQARSTLKGGDLLNGYLFARKHGAGEVDVYRTSPATQASLLLYDVSSNPSVLLTSNDYGAYTNSFSASIAGSSGALTATFKDAYDNISKTSPTLGPAFTLAYSGNASAATVTVVKTLAAVGTITFTPSTTGGTIAASTTVEVQVFARNASGIGAGSTVQNSAAGSGTSTNSVSAAWTAITGATSYDVYVQSGYYGNTKTASIDITYIPSGTAAPPTSTTDGPDLVTTLTGQTDGSVSLDVNLAAANVTTVSALVAYLSGQIGYTATTATGAGAITSTLLDAVTAESVMSTGYTLTADVAAVVNWFNSTGYITAAVATGGTAAPAAVGLTPFTGGTDGTDTAQTWTNAASLIGTANPQLRYPVVLTSNAQYRGIVSTAIENAAGLMTTFFSRGFIGGTNADTDTVAEQGAAALNASRSYYAAPDFYDYDSSGVYTHFPSYMMAACFAGLAAGNPPQQPLTNQIIQVAALGGLDSQNQPMNETRALALAQAGVSAVYLASDGTLRIYQGISTDLISGDQTNTYKVEFSVGNSVDQTRIFIDQDLAQKFKGSTNYGTETYAAILTELNADLALCKDTFQWISGYTPASEITPAATNSTFLLGNATVNVVNPINGTVITFNLALPPQTATQG